MALNTAFIKQMQQKLLEDKTKLERDLNEIGSSDPNVKGKFDVEYPESGSNSDDDNAMEVTEYGDEIALKNRLEKELKDTVSALKQIDKGLYGICRYCKKDIQEKRLEARPASSSCIACKKALTQEV